MLSNVFNVTAFDLNDGFPSTTADTLYVYSLFCSRFLSVYEYTFCTFAFVSVVSFSSTICLIVSPLRYTAPEYPSASVAFTSILPSVTVTFCVTVFCSYLLANLATLFSISLI